MVVSVGESGALPDNGVPLTTVRVEEPAAAVIVTEVALKACQFRVTVWPLLIVVALAENVMVGATFGFGMLPQEIVPQIETIRAPQKIQRTACLLIQFVQSPG